MKRDLLKFLFGESQVDEEIAALVEDIENVDTEGVSDLKIDKAPLAKALKSLDIDADGLEHDTRGFSLVLPDGDSYRAIHAILNTPDSIHKLAQAGWVFSTQGDVAMIFEPAEFRFRFLEITTTEANNEEPKPTKGTAKNTAISDVIKKGREFASKKPEHYDTNPVEYDHEGSDSNKGVSAAKHGEQPEGKPKGVGESEESQAYCPKCHSEVDLPDNDPSVPMKCGQCGHEGVAKMGKSSGWTGTSQVRESEEWLERLAQKMFKKPYSALTAEEQEKVQQKFSPLGFGEAAEATAPPSSHSLEKAARHLYRKSYRELRGHERDKVKKHAEKRGKGFWESGVNEAGHKAGCQCGFCKNKGSFKRNVKDGNDNPEADEADEKQFRKDRSASPEGEAVRQHLGMKGSSDKVEHTFDSMPTPAELVDKLLLDCAAGIQDIPVQGVKPIDYKKRLAKLRKRRGEALESNPGTPPGILGHKSYPGMKITGGSKDRKFAPAKGMVQAHDEGSVVNPQTTRHAK